MQADSPAQGAGCQTFDSKSSFGSQDDIKYYKPKFPKNQQDFLEVSGYLLEDTFWDADTIKVVGDITIMEEVTLSIAAGTSIQFQGYFDLDVQGSILAVGTPEEFISFTYHDAHQFNFDANPFGCWAGIKFHDTLAKFHSQFNYCIFQFSKGLDDNKFGGVFSLYNFSNLTVENSIFQYNLAQYGGVLGLNYFSNPLIINNVFMNNYALTGASAIYTTYSHPVIVNNTIIENHLLNDEISYPTAAIDNYLAKPKIYNNIFWDNWTNFYTNQQLLNCRPFYVFNNLVMDGYDGEANIDLDPLFDDDLVYQLSSISPCIDAGASLNYCDNFPVLDILGNYRISGDAIDIGAFEYQGISVADNENIPDFTNPLSCYPNPFVVNNHRNQIAFELQDTDAKIISASVFDLRGRKVKDIVADTSKRSNKIYWQNSDNLKQINSGIYLIKVITEDSKQYLSKLIILK